MADDPIKTDPATGDPSTDPKTDPAKGDDLPEGARKALDASRAAEKAAEKRAREAEKAAKEAREELEAAKNAGKSELEKVTDRLATLEGELSTAAKRALRAEVASEKGLPPRLAARLQGETREELEADADELLELVPAGAGTDGARTAGPGSFGGGQRAGGKALPDGNDAMNDRLRRLLPS